MGSEKEAPKPKDNPAEYVTCANCGTRRKDAPCKCTRQGVYGPVK